MHGVSEVFYCLFTSMKVIGCDKEGLQLHTKTKIGDDVN